MKIDDADFNILTQNTLRIKELKEALGELEYRKQEYLKAIENVIKEKQYFDKTMYKKYGLDETKGFKIDHKTHEITSGQ